MAMKGAPFIIGVGGVAAASAAAWLGLETTRPASPKTETPPPAAAARSVERADARICLEADIGIAEAKKGGCYLRRDFAGMEDSPVRDADGAPVTVSLSHPTDFERDASPATTCAEYRGLVEAGWYALSQSEMRREAWFERACGVLSMLERARTPDATHFAGDRLAAADMASLAKETPFRIGDDDAEASPTPATVSGGADGVWTLSAGGQSAVVQEIAHADFNADGLGDVLVFVSLSVEGGTATAAEVGVVEKKAADGPCAYSGAIAN